MEKLVSKDLYHMHMQFINGIQELNADEPTVMILLLIVLFYPERGPLEQQEHISKVQEKYLLLLNKYVQWRYGPLSNKIFPKVRKINNCGIFYESSLNFVCCNVFSC